MIYYNPNKKGPLWLRFQQGNWKSTDCFYFGGIATAVYIKRNWRADFYQKDGEGYAFVKFERRK